MKISILKRGVILLIAVIMCLSTFVSVGTLNAFADEVPKQDKTVVFSFPRDGDENYTAEWGHEELHYMNGWSQKESKRTHIYAIGSWEGNVCYCIEPGTPIDNDQTVNSNDETYWDNYPSEYNKTLIPDDIKKFIGRIMQYGYCGTVTTAWRSQNEADADKMSHAIATQLLIWETIVGERDENFNHVNAGECDAILDTISANHPLYSRIINYYNSIVKSVQNHSKIPSFFKKSSLSAQVVTLSWNGTNYTATLNDTNNVLGNYTFTTNNSKVTCSVSGNKLTVSSSTAINSEVTITANKVNGKRKGLVVWGDGIYDTGTGDIQDLVTFSAEVDDPVVGYVKVKVSSGSAKIVKTSEDGKVSGVKFTVVGNGINTTVTTNANGEITVPNLTAGTYTVTEVVGNIYEPQESRTLTVVAGQTATVNFNNTLKRGNLVVTKTSEDGLVSGVKFRLYGKADNGLSVDEYAVTDSSGKAYFNDVLIGSNYTLVEVDTKSYYITPVAQTVKIEWNKATNKTVNNVLKLGELKVTKTAEDGMVSGVKFRLYGTSDSGIAVNLYATTNAKGVAEFKNVLMGSNYKLEEVDTKAYYITPSVQNATIEWNKVTNKSFSNTLKRGNLAVTKTAEDGLVSGVKFHLYGTSDSGIKVDEYATTNSKGIAEFKNILIGSNYTLEEIDTKSYYVTPVKQTVKIEWNKVTNKSFNNVLKRGDLVVTKTSDDGFVKDITFRLYGTAANGTTVDVTAKTDASGKAYFNDILIGSNYKLEEVNTKAYYITPVTQTGVSIKWDDVTNSSVHNELKVGDLTVTKTAEDGMVSGVKFHLYGTSDSGIKVDEYATTNSKGMAEFKDILIGSNYTLEEVDTKSYYVTPVKQTGVKIEWNKVTNKSFNNVLKRGELKVVKTSEDDMVEGVKFHLVGTSDSGIKVDLYAVTDKNGIAVFEDVLIGKNYTLSEVNTEFKYITPVSQNTTIEWNKVTEKGFYNELKRGDLTVTKNSEDGLVEGITFRLYGKAECGQYVDVYATTDKSGKAYFKDILIGSAYTIEECNVSEKYITPVAQTNVVIEWDKVTQTTFENVLKRGALTVTKTAEDGLVEGLTFHLYGYSLSGIYVDEYAVTNGNGIAEFKDILIGTNYALAESNCPDRYVVPELQDAAIEWNKVTNKSFDNILKKWNAEVYKVDSEYDNAQGDATLEGAVYGVYKGDVLIDRYTTDENGYFITEYYPCGDDWTISEISPSEGYLLDETVYEIGAEANKYTVELNPKQFTVKETVVKGSISIIKHCDDGSTQIETPEVGAEFQVFLSSALSYENAKETERDILVCDEHGYAQTKDLPYGIYTVKQTKGWDGRDLMPEFTVVIDENGKVYRYLINNSVFESLVQIIKVDAETGNTIPYAGAGFKIYDPNGKLVTMTLTYPEVVTVDTFYTSEHGYLITPESLEYGVGYYLIEEQAPYGYVLDKTPVYFDITEDNSTTENAVTVVKVTKENTAQKGIIKITKSGEVFSSVIEKDGRYQPIYSVSGLAGAVYEITAAEDVITLDGTVRYEKGEVVSTLTTDENGYAESQPLYLGKFIVREVTAPYGMVLNTEPVTVELTYAGQEVEITDTSASFVNDRQKISIDLIKSMEKDDLFGIGNNDEVLSVKFALYAARDIIAADGTMIPKGGLIEIASCDVDGKLTFNTDMPVGSIVIIKEYSTDEHYILYEGEFLVVFDYAGQDEKIVHITLNDCADITNEIIRGTVIGKKVDEDGFSIAGALFGLFNPDETVFTEEMALMVSESNEIGVFGFKNVPCGNWVIRELKPAPAFVLNEEIYEVNISEDEQIIEMTAVNRFICGSVRVWKVDEEVPDNKPTNAVFAVYCDVDGNGEFNAEIDMLVGELTELEAGLYGMDNLRYNSYFLHEEKAPDGFIKDDNYYYFEIRNDGEVIYIENKVGVGFVNKPILSNVQTTKVDEEYPDNKLSGAVFGIYLDTDGDGVFNAETDTLIGEMTETEIGVYTYEALRMGGYFLYEKTAPIGFVKDNDYYYFEITEDGKTVTVENESGVGFANKPITGELKILKIVSETKQPLANVGFRVMDADGNIIEEAYTDENGIVTFNLRYGEYTYCEFSPLEGYYANNEVYPFAIIEDGEVIEIEFENEPIPEPDPPQTGDNNLIGFWIGLAAIAFGGIIAAVIVIIKQKKEDDN